jgi:hypothetical protein
MTNKEYKMPLRIGIWFDPSHIAYGGPAQVIIGTMLGFLQASDPPLILLNSPGDLNWLVDTPASWVDFDLGTRGLKRALGPLLFSAADVHVNDPNTSSVWRMGSRQLTLYLAPSTWFGSWVSHGMPFYDLSHQRPLMIWGGGVNTDFFRPSLSPKVHSFFIYFKSQRWSELAKVHEYMFRNYFRMHGPTLVYYFYSHEELLAAATGSEFCIYMGGVETQGLGALEIMACGCPLFVLDITEFSHNGLTTQQATSVCCWDARCGVKSSLQSIEKDFPTFLAALGTYTPRSFVEERYSWKMAAGNLRKAMEELP